jgi:HEAT repeat protein
MGKRWNEATSRAAVGQLLEGRTANQVLDFDDPACWTALDQAVRAFGRYWWDEYDPRTSGRLRQRQETALCHPDGRVRENALVTGARTSAFWHLVVVRCTDWVEPVRLRARALLRERLTGAPEQSLRDLTPLVLRLGRRVEGGWARGLFEEALGAVPDLAQSLLRDSRDSATRRLAARVALDHGLLDVRALARRAAGDPDPVLARLWTDAALAAMAAQGPDDHAVDILLGGRMPLVRSAGVTALRQAGRAHEAANHLADRSGLVRACARWVISQDGGDPHARHLELCGHLDTVAPYAVTGLAECGRREDAALLRTLLTHPSGGVRAQAVAGLRLLESASVETVLPLVDDPAPAVAREAARALLPYARRLCADRLTERLSPRWPTATRQAAFRLLRERGGVVQLRSCVALLADTDPRLRVRAESTVRNRTWMREVPPGDAEVDRLLRQCAHLFSEDAMDVTRTRIGLARSGTS